MTLEEVIELGKKATETTEIYWFSVPWWVWILIVLSIPCLIFVIIDTFKYDFFYESASGLPLSFIILTCICYIFTVDTETHDGITPWRNEVAKPYIESLPVERKEIVFIKIDPELSHETHGNTFWGTGYTRSTAIEKTPLTVSYKDNGIATRTDWYEAHMELTDEEKPYIEFQRLSSNLGHEINAGLYNVKVYLPESYEFTDIK